MEGGGNRFVEGRGLTNEEKPLPKGKGRRFSKPGLSRRQLKNAISFLLPHGLFSSFKCVLLPIGSGVRYGACKPKDDIGKTGVQGGLLSCRPSHKPLNPPKEHLFSLSLSLSSLLSFVSCADDFMSIVLQ
jgi:hypothetical protein